jgi:hypothetical protein
VHCAVLKISNVVPVVKVEIECMCILVGRNKVMKGEGKSSRELD